MVSAHRTGEHHRLVNGVFANVHKIVTDLNFSLATDIALAWDCHLSMLLLA